jgi:ElaB/YqjD/DUF883 family membrane-anchored ribosome-binding protein
MRRDELSAHDYEREAEATRRRLAQSLGQLSDRFTPGQLVDEMLTYTKAGGGTFFRALTNATRENPIPSLLIGAGCMMFLSEKMGLSHSAAGGKPVGETVGTRVEKTMSEAAASARSRAGAVRSNILGATDVAHEQASNLVEGVKEGAGAVGATLATASQRMREVAHDARDQMAAATGQLSQNTQEAGEAIQEKFVAIGEQISETAGRTQHVATNTLRQVKEQTISLVNEQPLLIAAVGLAIGAAIAAVLPSTATEDEMMGKTSDAVKRAVGEVALAQYETAKTAVGQVAEEAKGAVHQGLTSGVAERTRDVSEEVKRIVTETVSAGLSERPDQTGVEKQN